MVDTTTNRFHKLGVESGAVHREDEAIISVADGISSFLEQFEGDRKTAAAIMVASAAAKVLQDTVTVNWTENPHAVEQLADTRLGMELLADLAVAADQGR
jgi:hypothetical protein